MSLELSPALVIFTITLSSLIISAYIIIYLYIHISYRRRLPYLIDQEDIILDTVVLSAQIQRPEPAHTSSHL